MDPGRDGVILLHGIGRSSRSMRRIEQALKDAGYATLNLDYPGRRLGLSELAEHVREQTEPWIDRLAGRVHLVTHSMGALVARAWIARHRPAALGRVVMLAPPSQGSEIADLLRDTRLFQRVYGPAGQELVTQRSAELDALLGTIDYEVGVIAGDRSLDPLSWAYLPKPNDGKVTVTRTRLDGMADHIIVPATHTFIMRHPAAIAATLAFLRDGRFPR